MYAKELAFLVDQLSTTMWFFLDRIQCENFELCEAERNLTRSATEYLTTLRQYNKKLEVENNDLLYGEE